MQFSYQNSMFIRHSVVVKIKKLLRLEGFFGLPTNLIKVSICFSKGSIVRSTVTARYISYSTTFWQKWFVIITGKKIMFSKCFLLKKLLKDRAKYCKKNIKKSLFENLNPIFHLWQFACIRTTHLCNNQKSVQFLSSV